ncbi:hypothetical protein G6R40_08780 [Chryseobacterium sp. POL2]|uniref:hypothetical protein n=1 Tax=Chryseobacterium sp. POL2 TaxID=2713414 RepID=UPI0013E1F779|nr:hypothetical protein [Chryseobacterium sp. POL2]QIG89752.1 hypothetical protein G6R40_08780 [Chryseobacterium sp. POL2]
MESKHIKNDLQHIRQMMERSSRFISLSGLSGIFAGITALVGAFVVYRVFESEGVLYFDNTDKVYSIDFIKKLIGIGLIILFVAVFSGYFFTARKSKQNDLKIWDATTKRLLINFGIPLVAGGIFCMGLVYQHYYVMIAPATLVFYGLALINAEKYTLTDVKYLGISEVFLGLISLFFLGYGLLFWAIGFGVLHIVYGLIMYKKYDSNK